MAQKTDAQYVFKAALSEYARYLICVRETVSFGFSRMVKGMAQPTLKRQRMTANGARGSGLRAAETG